MATNSKPWSLYVVLTVDNTFYAGISTDSARRFGEHQSQGRQAAKYLISHKPHALIFSQLIGSHSMALKVEYNFKRLPRSQKKRVIQNGVLVFDSETGKILF